MSTWTGRFAVAVVVAAAVAPARAGDSPDPELTDVHAHLTGREPEKARAVIRRRLRDGRDTDDLRWADAWSHLRRIDRHEGAMRLEQSAHAARELGLYALEYRLWMDMFEAAEWANGKTRGRWAGVAALRIGRFAEGRDLLAADVQCAGGERGALIDAFAASDQGPLAKIEFAEKFWLTPGRNWQQWRAGFETIVSAVHRADLDDALVDRAYPIAYHAALMSRQDGWAGNVLRVWLTRRDGAGVLERVTAIHDELADEHHRGRPELDVVLLRVDPDAKLSPIALAKAADVLREMGETGLAERSYRRAIALIEPTYDKPYPSGGDAVDVHTALDSSRLGLAAILEEAGRPAEALALYRKWTAWTGCGNCTAYANGLRALHEARCLVAMGQAEEAVRDHLLPHYAEQDGFGGPVEALIDFHVATEADRGRLDALETSLAEIEKEHPSSAAAVAMARRFAEIRRARDDADIERLIDLLVACGEGKVFHAAVYEDWETPLLVRRITDVLAERGDAVARLTAHFDALPAAKPEGDPARGVLVHALYVHPAEEATEALRAIEARLSAGEALGLDPKTTAQRVEVRVYGL